MDFLQTLILFVHVITVITLITLVLIQHGKGADAGAAFGGGASQTVFGSQGSTGFLTKFTAALAVVFFITSFSLAIFAKNQAAVAAGSGITAAAQSVPKSKSAQSESKTSAPAAASKQGEEAGKAQQAAPASSGSESGAKGDESSQSSKSGDAGSGKGSGIPKLQ